MPKSFVKYKGKVWRLCDILREKGIEKHVYFERLNNDWSVEEALDTEVRKYRKRKQKGKDA